MADEYRSRMERRNGSRRARSRKKKGGGLLKKMILYCLIAVLLIIIVGSIWIFSIIQSAPELTSERLETPFSSQIYDQDGKLVTTLFKEHNRMKVDIQDVPATMKKAVTSIEDRRFYQHSGIDIRRIFGALIANVKNGWGSEGGSTITQQVVKRTILSPEKTLPRKVKEAYLAMKLEQSYSKDKILQVYLNNIYYGNGAYGLITASKTYFGTKDLSQLNVSQMALLAGLPNAPSYYNPFQYPERAADRRNQVLHAMVQTDAISEKQAKKARAMSVEKLVKKQKDNNNDKDQPYQAFVDRVYHELVIEREVISDEQFYQGGLKIYTTLDMDAQKDVDQLLKSDQVNYPDEAFEAGVALIDTQTGAIRAVGGGRDFLAIGDTNYGTEEKSPPGSTFKPIIDYGPAIEYLHWATDHTLVDEPYAYSDETPIHEWDGEYWGSMTMRRALEWSRNIPALKTFQAVGKEKATKFAKHLGIDLEKPIPEAAAIGGLSSGVTPLQLAGAYAAFGNEGIYHKPYSVTKIIFQNGDDKTFHHDSVRAMHDYTAYMMTDMLKTVMTSGTGAKAHLSGIPVAGKTGSTNIPNALREQYNIGDGLLDSWFAGYTTQYTAAIWTGYPKFKDGNKVHYIRYDGSEDIAKAIFKKLMTGMSDPDTPDFDRPDSVGGSGNTLYVQKSKPARSVGDEQQDNDSPDQKQKTPSKQQKHQHDQEQEQPDQNLEKEQNKQPDGEQPDKKSQQNKNERKDQQKKDENNQDSQKKQNDQESQDPSQAPDKNHAEGENGQDKDSNADDNTDDQSQSGDDDRQGDNESNTDDKQNSEKTGETGSKEGDQEPQNESKNDNS
ncbi:transglycosylase domain-containing protein [Tuberibacillus sp. Marseille-P3662]|uniref:transglycosylase domain-containing protein n=1 Tax=Tuberibacillus sp. Marseille-P3662 TaxID=1965358 RepID=UPI00111C1031|nr:transglycosylase domain-containing protein [Tuberibacillus sp. Marseille-P3662]